MAPLFLASILALWMQVNKPIHPNGIVYQVLFYKSSDYLYLF